MISIDSWIDNMDVETIISEQDVRTKIAMPLLKHLGFAEKYQANEFPIYSFSGRTRNHAKLVDLLCFYSSDWANHKNSDSRSWVHEYSLLSFELKNPSERLEQAEGQAEFYSMNARAPFYMCTNGLEIKIFEMRDYTVDKIIFDGPIENLSENWHSIYNKISFEKIKELKQIKEVELEKIYLDYCTSLKNQYKETYNWYWEQTVTSLASDEEVSMRDIMKKTNDIVIGADAGTGKTTYLHHIFIKYCENYLQGTSEIVPIFLSAKLWQRDYYTVLEGILSELNIFLPHLTIEILKNEIANDKIILLVDGIDECFINRDILLKEINNLTCQTMITSREINFDNYFKKMKFYRLNILNEEKMINISTDILNENTHVAIHKMKSRLKELLKTPIYFNMWLIHNLEKKDQKLEQSINISELYQSFTSYLLNRHVKNKGNFDIESIPISSLHMILSEFAYNLYEKNNIDIIEIIKEMYPNSIQTIYKILLQSGLIFETCDQCEFQQHSLKEYYYAKYILKNDDFLDRFLQKKTLIFEYEEIFIILVGLTKDISKQNDILNYLLNNNFSLFIKCLHRRYNFSDEFEGNKSQNFYEEFFDTISKTYSEIIDLYFSKIRKFFLPFSFESNYSGDMGIHFACHVNLEMNSIGLRLITTDDKRDKISINYDYESPKIISNKNNKKIEIPFGSLRGSEGTFTYNLNHMKEGIDYAREIAVDMIYYNIELILKEKTLLERELPLMQFAFVEEWLKKASPLEVKRGNKLEVYNLSFKEQSIDELLSLLRGIFPYRITPGFNQDKNVTFGLLWYLIEINKNYTENMDKILFPNQLKNPIGKKRWVWNYYTDEDIIKWITNYYYIGQLTYREFVEKTFPDIGNDLNYYQMGPIKYYLDIELPDRNSNDYFSAGGISSSYHLVSSIQESEPLITISNKTKPLINSESHFEEIKKEATFFGRKLGSYITSSGVLTNVFDSENNVRKFVYGQLQKDFKRLFKQS